MPENEIVKVCKNHGPLTQEFVWSWISKKGNKENRCKHCSKNHCKKYYKEHVLEFIERTGEWKRKNREILNARAREDRKNNPAKYKKWEDSRYAKNPSTPEIRLIEVLRERGLTKVQHDKMLEKHDNLCAICKRSETKKSRTPGNICRLAIDHCHYTNKVRGLLCHSCNAALGQFRDSIDIMQRAIEYIRVGGFWPAEEIT